MYKSIYTGKQIDNGIKQAVTNKQDIDLIQISKQDKLTQTQLKSVNSGITSDLVAQITTNKNDISNKQDNLSQEQLTSVNSGITSDLVAQITTNKQNISNKQDKLTQAQLTAVNSGITNKLVNQITTNKENITTIENEVADNMTSIATVQNDITSLKNSDTTINEALKTKQDTLVSGTNIKTINGENILGQGNIEIQGGGSSISAINPNILINGEFKINQRDKSVYYGPNTYSLDRWELVDEDACLERNSSDETLYDLYVEDVEESKDRVLLVQKIENYEFLKGMKVTAHLDYQVLIEDKTGTTYLEIDDGVNPISELIESTTTNVSTTISSNATHLWFKIVSKSGLNLRLVLHYAKLEIGNEYTGKYFIPYAQDLLNCQRYFQTLQVFGYTTTPALNNEVRCTMPIPTAFRIIPSVEVYYGSNYPKLINETEEITTSSIYNRSKTYNSLNDSVVIGFGTKTNVTMKKLYTFTKAIICCDAEM